jgi:putative ABC transport system ATP-binding protein
MIEVKKLVKKFKSGNKSVLALNEIDLKIEQGEFVLIKGPSGCGKSTLLFSLGGLQKPTNGDIQIAGENLYSISERERLLYRSLKIGFVFQSYYLIPYLTVAENILIINKVKGINVSEEIMLEITKRLKIDHRLNHLPSELSVGEKQRTSLARAMIGQPEVILADEPTGNLDPDNARQVLQYLNEFKKGGGTVIMVTHGAEADVLADRQIYMKEGKLVTNKGIN